MKSTDFSRVTFKNAQSLVAQGATVKKLLINPDCGGVFVGEKLVKTWGTADPHGHRNANEVYWSLREC